MSTINQMLAFLVTKTGGLSLAEISQFCETYGVDASTVTITAIGGETTAPAKRRGRKPGRRKAKAETAVAKKSKGGKKKAPPRVNGKDHEAVAKKSKNKKETEALDPKVVVAAIKELKDEEGWVKAETIKAKLGCDAAALRGVLNALIEDDKVKYTGKARGTQYAIA